MIIIHTDRFAITTGAGTNKVIGTRDIWIEVMREMAP